MCSINILGQTIDELSFKWSPIADKILAPELWTFKLKLRYRLWKLHQLAVPNNNSYKYQNYIVHSELFCCYHIILSTLFDANTLNKIHFIFHLKNSGIQPNSRRTSFVILHSHIN